MNIKRSLALPLAALAIIGTGLTIGAALPTLGVGTPTPTASAPFTLPPALDINQLADTGGRECERERNRICDNMPEPMERAAWRVFDAYGGAEKLLVNPASRVELVGYSIVDPYAQGEPALDIHQLALHDSGIWYIYTANPID